MKRLLLIFVLCFLLIFGILFCYADETVKAVNIREGLPLTAGYAAAEQNKMIELYNGELPKLLAEQQLNLNILNSIYYFGSYQGVFTGSSLSRSLDWPGTTEDRSPLFASEIYQGYLRLRTEKVLQTYQTSGMFDYTAFIQNSRAQFDSYVKGAVKTDSAKEQLLVQLQERLADKLPQLIDKKRKPLLDEIMSFRLPTNNSKSMDLLYQLFEEKARMETFDKLAALNKQKLEKLMDSIGVVVSSEKNGTVEIKGKGKTDTPVQILNVLTDGTGYKGYIKLAQLYKLDGASLSFAPEGEQSFVTSAADALKDVHLDDRGLVSLNLDEWTKTAQNPQGSEGTNTVQQEREKYQKALAQMYQSKSKQAQEIIKELNRYSIYLDLKNKKTSNYYTKNFEDNLTSWKKSLDSKLNAFGPDGIADYVGYIKRFEQLNRTEEQTQDEALLIARFRNTDLQFKDTQEGMLWILDLLYKLKYMPQ